MKLQNIVRQLTPIVYDYAAQMNLNMLSQRAVDVFGHEQAEPDKICRSLTLRLHDTRGSGSLALASDKDNANIRNTNVLMDLWSSIADQKDCARCEYGCKLPLS